MKKAVVFGATGFVGSYLVRELLASPEYEKVTIVVRKDPGIRDPKLLVLIADFQTLESVADQLEADEVFITLGTTRKKTPDRKVYYQVDHDYPVLATQVAKRRGARAVFLLTAVGSDPDSRVFYIRTKGEAERDVIAVGLNETHIFQPSMILGQREEFRLWERMALAVWSLFDGVMGDSKYRGISGEYIAKAMVAAAATPVPGVRRYEWKEMMNLVESSSRT